MRVRTATVLGTVAALSWVAAAAGTARAQYVTPASYTGTPGQGQAQGGSLNYFDDTGSQLTDGALGADNWGADLGNGSAYEWVGWISVDPTFTFTFSAPVSLSAVEFGFNRGEGSGIYLPSSVTIDGVTTALTGTEIANGTRGFVSLGTTFTGTSLTITVADADAGRWIFLDEVRFVSAAAAVPELGTLPLAASGLLPLAAVWVTRRRGRRQRA